MQHFPEVYSQEFEILEWGFKPVWSASLANTAERRWIALRQLLLNRNSFGRESRHALASAYRPAWLIQNSSAGVLYDIAGSRSPARRYLEHSTHSVVKAHAVESCTSAVRQFARAAD